MKEVLKLVFVLFIVSCTSVKDPNQPTFGIVIHGGAGTILKENMTPEMENAYENKLAEAISVGHKILKEGGSSQEAVEKTIHVMENSPLFNSGKGAVLTAEESIALDASFMNGNTLDAGAVAGVKHIKNPISAAIRVMKNSPHVMLAGEGADYFAANQGLDTVPESYFITENRLNDLRRVKQRESDQKISINLIEEQYFKNQRIGTVGCVALDLQGNLSAGTSTGGMTNKKWGRIGDAPIIGAGTYANNASCGVSATGWGEFFIRSVVAHDIAALVEYRGLTINEASKRVMKKVKDLGGDGGVVVLDTKGNVAMEFNTPGMYRAHMDSDGNLEVKIYRDE
jgi:beta-aspartyl-peptidase (threonine type)